MSKQLGSVILILLIVISLTSMTSIMILQINYQFIKQINLVQLANHATQLLATTIESEFTIVQSGINYDNLPTTDTDNQQIHQHDFTVEKNVDDDLTIDFPLAGYSLNSIYQTRLIEFAATASSSMVKTSTHQTGLGCLNLGATTIPDRVDAFYALDFDRDSITDVSYQFDAVTGAIHRAHSSNELLIDLGFDADQRFNRADFVLFNFGRTTKLAIIFVVHNTPVTAATATNTLYVILDRALFGATPVLPLVKAELIDLENHPLFSADEKGYFFELDQGPLPSPGLTTINGQIYLITQTPSIDPNSGLTEYQNKLVIISLEADSAIAVNTQSIPGSPDLLNLQLSTVDHQTVSLATQYGSIASLTGECRKLYQYEDYGL